MPQRRRREKNRYLEDFNYTLMALQYASTIDHAMQWCSLGMVLKFHGVPDLDRLGVVICLECQSAEDDPGLSKARFKYILYPVGRSSRHQTVQ